MTGDEMEGVRQLSDGFHHWFPFAALFAKQVVPANRPMTTRIIEQIFVGIVAGGGSAYSINDVMNARQEEQIKYMAQIQAIQNQALQDEIRDSERRLTSQIAELRARQLK